MKKLILTAALSASFLPACLAGPIDGVVKDKKTGETLIGSVVQVKGNQDNMTTTGLDGSFTLKNLPDQGTITLVVNYIGYKPKEITIDMANASHLKIELEPDTHELNEVVVKGFKSNRTDVSAVSMVKNSPQVLNVMSAQAIQLSPDVNVASVLQRVSGVTMQQDAGGKGIITGCTFADSGNSNDGGEAINVKSGCTLDVAYNLIYNACTNAFKLSDGGVEKNFASKLVIYNNTIVDCGWRRTKNKKGSQRSNLFCSPQLCHRSAVLRHEEGEMGRQQTSS